MGEKPEVKVEEIPIPAGEETPPVVEAVEEIEAPAPSEEEIAEALAEKPKEQKGLRKRFSELTTKISTLEAEKEAAYWKGKAEALASKPLEVVKPPDLPGIPEPVLPPKPRKEDFKDADGYEDADGYYEALTDWKVETRLTQEYHKQAQEKTKQEHERNMGEAQKFIAKIHAKHPDYQEVSRNVQFPDLVAGAIMQTGEVGPDVAYHLAKNPAELLRISHLPPIAQVVEIGQLAVKLSTPALQPKTIPGAPAPIKPLTPSGVVSTPSYDQMDTAEFMAMRDKEEFGTP